jgi:hypothetical protein
MYDPGTATVVAGALGAGGMIGGSLLGGKGGGVSTPGVGKWAKKMQQPFYEAGHWALDWLKNALAQGPGEYEQSPYYNFLLEEGTRGLERGAAARGKQFSGAEQKALTGYGQNLAKTDYQTWLGNWYQSLTPYQSLAGMGQTSANQLTSGLTGLQSQASMWNAANQSSQNLGYANTLAGLTNWGGQQILNYANMNKGNALAGPYYNPNTNQGAGYLTPNSYMDY